MKYSNPAPLDSASAFRRFMLTLTLDPQKAILFWCGVCVLLITLIFGGDYAVIMRHAAARTADLQDAPIQTAIAVVQGRTPWDRSSKMNPANSGVVLRLSVAGKPAATPDVADERTFGVRIGDNIHVKYRVGKSGSIYIADWQPLAH